MLSSVEYRAPVPNRHLVEMQHCFDSSINQSLHNRRHAGGQGIRISTEL